jgi:hypothetical protein
MKSKKKTFYFGIESKIIRKIGGGYVFLNKKLPPNEVDGS